MPLPQLIDVETFFADPDFSGASISPDGTRIAYLAPSYGRTNVWVRGIDQEHDDAVCVTHDQRRGIKRYFWTDDPRWLLYLQDTDGNEDWHLYRVDLDNPAQPAVDLTPIDPGSRVFHVEPWKPLPGTVLVVMNRRPAYVDAFLIDLASGDTTVLYENPTIGDSFLFGPNGEIFVATNTQNGELEVRAVDKETGEQRFVIRLGGGEYPLGTLSRVTADGTGLLFGLYPDDSDDLQLVRVDAETGEKSLIAGIPGHSLCLASLVAESYPPTLYTSQRTGEVLAARFVGDRPIIHIIDPDFADVYENIAALSDGVLESLSSDEAEQLWVATFSHDREPGLTYLYDHSTGASRVLFRPYPNLDPADLAPMTGVSFTARDGLPLHAFLTLPVGVDPTGLPLVLHVHGGPWFHDVWQYDRETQLLANRGYAVLQVNFRGSSGYGKRHITSAIRQFAGTMHDDLIDAADWAVKQGYADPTRIAIYGGSYGGYAALVAVTFTPDYFAAAVDYVGISSLPDFLRDTPEWVRPALVNNWLLYCGDPDDPEQHADLLARSPITMVDRITTPLMVVQGANDARVKETESANMVAALEARGVPTQYILAADEGHGFQNPENSIRMFKAIERFFAEHLGGRSG